MNIYKVERADEIGYDEYDSFIIIAENEDVVRETDPEGKPVVDSIYRSCVRRKDLDSLEITRIGVTDPDQQPGIVLAPFNAG